MTAIGAVVLAMRLQAYDQRESVGVAQLSRSEIDRLPRKFVNGVGIEMQLVVGGEYYMGSDQLMQFGDRQVARFGPKHLVRLSPFYVARREVTIRQFEQFLSNRLGARDAQSTVVRDGERGHGQLSPEVPVTAVSWNDAVEFCEWLSARENCVYRLPTEAEWEYFCRAGAASRYWWGNSWDIDSYRVAYRTGDSSGPFPGLPKPYGFFPQNQFGLYDVLGDAYEWTSDWHDLDAMTTYRESPIDDPQGPRSGRLKVKRGGSVQATRTLCDCVSRGVDSGIGSGFRIVRQLDRSILALDQSSYAHDAPRPTVMSEAKSSVLPRRRLRLGNSADDMEFVLLPEGEFLLGSSADEYADWRTPDEGPLTAVRVPAGIWFAVTEVTVGHFKALGAESTVAECNSGMPVHGPDAREIYSYLDKLNSIARLDGQLSSSEVVRLPTETEWEYACRAGSDAAFCFGSDERDLTYYGWVDQASGPFPVGSKLPNAWGIHDMHGNVWEMCCTGPWAYPGVPIANLRPPAARTLTPCRRGGGWAFAGHRARSSARQFSVALEYVGVRLVISE